MSNDLRYLKDSKKSLGYAFDVFQQYFADGKALETFFNSIGSAKEKNKFLKVASFYKFLVKDGNFVFDEPELRSVVDYYVDYIDETYKYIAIFALIEGLLGQSDFVEFYNWLLQNHEFGEAPITSKNKLRNLYSKYLKEFGATQKAVNFFSALDSEARQLIESKIQVQDGSSSIEALAELLYDIRSEFVHDARFVLELGKGTVISTRSGKRIVTKLTLGDLCKVFERGVLLHYGYSASLPPLS